MHFLYTAPRYHTNQHYPVSSLLAAGHEVSFLVLRRGESETYEAVEPVVLGTSRFFDLIRRVASLVPGIGYSDVGGLPPVVRFILEVRARRPDVLVVRNPSSMFGLLAVFASKVAGSRLIFYSQSSRHFGADSSSRFLVRLLCRATDANWFTPVFSVSGSHPSIDDPVRYVPFVIPGQLSADAKRWFVSGTVNLLAVGKFEPRKNHCLFLDAIAALSQRHRVSATIIGECSTRRHRRELARVRQYRHRLGLDDQVTIELNVPFAEVQSHYSRHDVFVLASRDEPAAVSPLEAMAHSLPVVCSDTNGTRCYIRPGENGYVFRTDDLDDLVDGLDGMLACREGLVDMGRRSYELVETEHAPARYADSLVAMASKRRQVA